jgi:hypothetical protein
MGKSRLSDLAVILSEQQRSRLVQGKRFHIFTGNKRGLLVRDDFGANASIAVHFNNFASNTESAANLIAGYSSALPPRATSGAARPALASPVAISSSFTSTSHPGSTPLPSPTPTTAPVTRPTQANGNPPSADLPATALPAATITATGVAPHVLPVSGGPGAAEGLPIWAGALLLIFFLACAVRAFGVSQNPKV